MSERTMFNLWVALWVTAWVTAVGAVSAAVFAGLGITEFNGDQVVAFGFGAFCGAYALVGSAETKQDGENDGE